MLRIKNKGQTSMEFSILLIVVIAALLTMQNYMKRGVQGRWRESIDDMGDQYDPRTTISDIRHTLTANTNTQITTVPDPAGYWTMRTDDSTSTETRTGDITVGAY